MKSKWLYIFGLFLCGMFVFSGTQAGNNVSHTNSTSRIAFNSTTSNSQKIPVGDSPFIRFHHGIDESSVSISTPVQLLGYLKPLEEYIPEKFAGITTYLSSLSYILPVTREFLYSTPLRSPPVFS